MIKVKIIQVQFPNNPLNAFDIPKLRGSIARRFPKYRLIHNHLENGRLRYGYPLIQFKVISRIPSIIGLSEGIDILKKVFMDIESVDVAGRRKRLWEKSIKMREDEFGQSQDFYRYRFLSSWMALKESNYETYRQLDAAEQQVFLRHLLRENLKTVSKGFQYRIPEIDSVRVEGFFRKRERNFKNNRMLCFEGDFMMNFRIPDYLGVGKQVARGFGTLARINRT